MNDEEFETYMTKQMIDSIEEELKNDLFDSRTFTTSTNNIDNQNLTLEKYQEMIYLLYPKLYYATANCYKKGKIYKIKETGYNPEYIVFHPDDFEQVKEITKGRTLVHIKDEPKEEGMKRLLKLYKSNFDDLMEDEINEFKYKPFTYLNYVWMNNYNKGES